MVIGRALAVIAAATLACRNSAVSTKSSPIVDIKPTLVATNLTAQRADTASFGRQAGHKVWRKGIEGLERDLQFIEGTAIEAFEIGRTKLHNIQQVTSLQKAAHAHNGDDNDDFYDDKLFRKEDTLSWIFFFVVFFVLVLFDNLVLHGRDDTLSFAKASLYMMFWLSCAALFNVYVYFTRGHADAFNWGTGYLLEWMLSVDNLFVFRSVFIAFRTPSDQKHKALFWGILGAVVFRMLFFIVEEVLLHTFSFMYVVLGLFLVYTGVKILVIEDEDVTPEADPVFNKVISCVPYVNAYAPNAVFFARLTAAPTDVTEPQQISGTGGAPNIWTRAPSKDIKEWDTTQPLRATKLLLVVICLELTDVVFAVDSVSAIVAQIPDLFLAYTACVFAMLGLRATFFVVDELVNMFSLLSYAVAAILVFIGLKLCLKGWVHIPHELTCLILVSTVALSIVGSVVHDHYKQPKVDDIQNVC